MDQDVVLAGWVHDVRVLGGISFILLRDMAGIVQVTAPKAKVSLDIVKEISTLHQEDVILVKGKVVASNIAKKGIEVIPEQLQVVNRAETPLPLDPRGVQNTLLETRLNWRFLDFRSEETNAIFKIQSKILQFFREFFATRHYVEIDAYLAQSPQLYKQMCAISFEKVFTVRPVFRAEKFEQPTHLNEVRQMDIEEAFATDEDVMKVLEEYLAFCLTKITASVNEELEKI